MHKIVLEHLHARFFFLFCGPNGQAVTKWPDLALSEKGELEPAGEHAIQRSDCGSGKSGGRGLITGNSCDCMFRGITGFKLVGVETRVLGVCDWTVE